MKQTSTMTALDAAAQAATQAGAETECMTLDQCLRRRGQGPRPSVWIVRVEPGQATDVAALRWLAPGGVSPLVLAASSFDNAIELAARAALFVKLAQTTTVILLEHEVAELEGTWQPPDQVKPGALAPLPPLDPLLSAPERDLRTLALRMEQAPLLSRFEPDLDAAAKAEWLVISFGSACDAGQAAASQARATGQRVGHLMLQTLWPLPEAPILHAARGVKHVVVPERNLGQYVHEIRRLLPTLMVIPANAVPGPVSAALILDRLQKTPRCC